MRNNKTFVKKNVIQIYGSQHSENDQYSFKKNNSFKTNIIDFSNRLNPFGSILKYEKIDINEIIKETTEQFKNYPDNRYLEFRHAAANFLDNGINFKNIVPESGICELLKLIFECCLNPGDKVIVPYPFPKYYSQYTQISGAQVIYLPLHKLLSIDDSILSSVKLVLLSNPNNLDGRLISRNELINFANRCASNKTLLLIDESGIELTDPNQTLTDITKCIDNLIIIRSLSHPFSIPALKIAYAVTSEHLASIFNNARLVWTIDTFTNLMGIHLLKLKGGTNCKYLQESRIFIENQRKFLLNGIKRIHGFSPISSDSNFFIVNLVDLFLDANTLVTNLALRGSLVKNCSHLYQQGKEILRINVRTQEKNEKLLKTIGEVLSETSRENARLKLELSLEDGTKKISQSSSRGTCQYYPCHFHGQDCTFCFCPFYPCKEENTGGQWITGSGGNLVWSCENCIYIHQSKLTRQILDVLMEEDNTDQNLEKAWRRIILPLL